MKFITRNNSNNYSVRLEGPQEEQLCFTTLVENMHGIKATDSFAGQEIEFPNKRSFEKFLLWRQIFKQCGPNKQFYFISFARRAICEVRAMMKNDLIEIC
jgi:hypothetical protein